MERRTFLKGRFSASAWAPVGREMVAGLITRHAEAPKAADMFMPDALPGLLLPQQLQLIRGGISGVPLQPEILHQQSGKKRA
ncbi:MULTISPECIES: hypothetical protein [unclassified Rhizobium]|uniref:hypothetical protein n=1 Tax=unclassified Rhizobium TaxID=2613769 RepID=UPI0021F6EAA3|nr:MULTISPECIES: hypothetical protein [unclassified Rhizobium]MCV9946224.1 hypothetical protein [Rhizobium sp. BT-175]MCW0020431.1 hypothetical protein [Rhizobium sp. BT-226]